MGERIKTVLLIFVALSLSISCYSTIPNGDASINLNKSYVPVIEGEEPAPPFEGIQGSSVAFTENRGQLNNPEIDYYHQGSGLSVGFAKGRVFYYLEGIDNTGNRCLSVVQLEFIDSNDAEPTGIDRLDHYSNFFYGSDPEEWIIGVHSLERIRYEDLWDGIDIEFYFSNGGLKYDILMDPFADPSVISFQYDGAENIRVDDSTGDLVVLTKAGDLIEMAPYTFQIADGLVHEVESGFEMKDKDVISFILGTHVPYLPVTIDPELIYSTFVGGNLVESWSSMECDADGYVYVAGYTRSLDFPTVPGSYDTSKTSTGFSDGYIFKLNISGDNLLYSTFLGSSKDVYLWDIAIDGNGSAFLLGDTTGPGFPTTDDAYKKSYTGQTGSDIFFTILNPSGTGLIYSTLFGNESSDYARDLDIDKNGNVYIFGYSIGGILPTPGAYDNVLNWGDTFLLKFNPSNNKVVFHTYIGNGTRGDPIGSIVGIQVDIDGCSYLSFNTKSTKFPVTSGAFDTSLNGDQDIGLMKVNANGTDLIYSTYFGGSKYDGISAWTLDSQGCLYGTGNTLSNDFPVNSTSYDSTYYLNRDVFIFKLNANGTGYQYSTYLGGEMNDQATGIVLIENESVYLTGSTWSDEFPTTLDHIERY